MVTNPTATFPLARLPTKRSSWLPSFSNPRSTCSSSPSTPPITRLPITISRLLVLNAIISPCTETARPSPCITVDLMPWDSLGSASPRMPPRIIANVLTNVPHSTITALQPSPASDCVCNVQLYNAFIITGRSSPGNLHNNLTWRISRLYEALLR
ncbi:hypothetical protein D3C81_1636930 [compost metagenome]